MSDVWKWSNGYCKRLKEANSNFIARIWSAEHFNFKRNSIEMEYDFQIKLYEKGEQNIQF